LGHEDQFPLRRLTARSVIRKRTVAATRGNGRDAPRAAIRLLPLKPARFPHFYWNGIANRINKGDIAAVPQQAATCRCEAAVPQRIHRGRDGAPAEAVDPGGGQYWHFAA
jgi:hypothetical protein